MRRTAAAIPDSILAKDNVIKLAKRSLIFYSCVAILVFPSSNAHAWFFFFIPGSVLSRIGDGISGATGSNCVSTKAKEGDVITSPTGNTAVIRRISGTSGRCSNPDLPIRAEIEFQYSFSSKAGIELPAHFKPKEISEIQRFNGMLLNVADETTSLQVVVTAQPRRVGSDGGTLARTIAANMSKLIENAKTSQEETLSINGLKAFRFQMTGTNKGLFGRSYTYIVTVLEGSTEYIAINVGCLSDSFPENARVMADFAANIKGISGSVDGSAERVSTVPTPEGQVSGTSGPASVSATVNAPNIETTAPRSALDVPSNKESASSANGDAVSEFELTEKLRTLDRLFREGLITKQDYEGQKQTLLRRYVK